MEKLQDVESNIVFNDKRLSLIVVIDLKLAG